MVNHIVHIELGVTNLTDAVKFYKQAFPHWHIEKDEGIPDYYFCRDEGNSKELSLGIGLVDKVEGRGSIVFYVNVEDIDTSIMRITEAGGTVILEKRQLSGDHGFIARFEDPFGNHIGVWSKYM